MANSQEPQTAFGGMLEFSQFSLQPRKSTRTYKDHAAAICCWKDSDIFQKGADFFQEGVIQFLVYLQQSTSLLKMIGWSPKLKECQNMSRYAKKWHWKLLRRFVGLNHLAPLRWLMNVFLLQWGFLAQKRSTKDTTKYTYVIIRRYTIKITLKIWSDHSDLMIWLMAFVRQSSSMNMESIRCRSCQLQKLPYAAGPSRPLAAFKLGRGNSKLSSLAITARIYGLASRVHGPDGPPIWYGGLPPPPPSPQGKRYIYRYRYRYIYIYIYTYIHT